MILLRRVLSQFNQLSPWRREVSVWGYRFRAVSFDRLLNLNLHRLGLMNTGMRSFLEQQVRPGMRVIDVGANQGLFTLLCSRLVGLGGHLKTGHRWSLQNRPTELTQDKGSYTVAKPVPANFFRKRGYTDGTWEEGTAPQECDRSAFQQPEWRGGSGRPPTAILARKR